MGCFSGCLMSSAGIQKLFCRIYSGFKCSFDEFVGEKVVSPSCSSTILGLPQIQRLLTAIYCPKEVAVVHHKGHSRDGSKVAKGNQLADCQARKAALYETPSQTPLIYTEEELERYEKSGANITGKGWL